MERKLFIVGEDGQLREWSTKHPDAKDVGRAMQRLNQTMKKEMDALEKSQRIGFTRLARDGFIDMPIFGEQNKTPR